MTDTPAADPQHEAIEAARLRLNEHFHGGQPDYVAAGHEGPPDQCCWCQESAEEGVGAAAPIIAAPIEAKLAQQRRVYDEICRLAGEENRHLRARLADAESETLRQAIADAESSEWAWLRVDTASWLRERLRRKATT